MYSRGLGNRSWCRGVNDETTCSSGSICFVTIGVFGTSAGRNGSSSVLIMSLYVIVPKKSRGNKKCDKEEEEEEERHIFGNIGIVVKWP